MIDKKEYTYSYNRDKPKLMDFDRATALLIAVKEALDEVGLKNFLFFGTLLGAYRENNFIYYDDDVDLAIFWEDYHKMEDVIPKIIEKKYTCCFGTRLGDKHTDLYFSKKGFKEKVDIYVLIPFRNHRVWCRRYVRPDDRHYVLTPFPEKYFENPETLNFKGKDFLIPSPIEEFLFYQWNTWWKATGGQIGKMKNMHVPTKEFDTEMGLT